MAYAFKQIEAHDPNNPGLVAPNASVTIFEPGDPTKTPLTLTTIAGDPLPNPVTVNGLGYGPAFMHATLSQVAWSGGGLTGTFESYEGLRDEAIAAVTAAENAAASAAAAAQQELEDRIAAGEFKGESGADGANVIPTDTAIAERIADPASDTAAAISATIGAEVTPLIEAQVPPMVVDLVASDTTVKDAAAAAVAADIEGRDLAEVTQASDIADLSFVITDDSGKKIWMEADAANGAPTQRVVTSLANAGLLALEDATDVPSDVVMQDNAGNVLLEFKGGILTDRIFEPWRERLFRPATPVVTPLPSDSKTLVHSIANNASKYTLNTWFPGTYASQSDPISFGGVGQDQIRPPSMAALGLAVNISSGNYSEATTGIPITTARATLKRLTTALAIRHMANGGDWGGLQPPWEQTDAGQAYNVPSWQSAMWAYNAGLAAWLTWADLTADEQAKVKAMVVWEADRFIRYKVAYWRNRAGTEIYPGDSKSEELGWNATLLGLACVMLPEHANAQAWMTKLIEMVTAAGAAPADLTSLKNLNGNRVGDLVGGYNVNADGTIVNHHLIHPDYMQSIGVGPGIAAVFAMFGKVAPLALFHNVPLVYSGFTDRVFDTPTYASPGGKIYQTNGTIYYPQGADWGSLRFLGPAAVDIAAAVFSQDTLSSTRAKDWAKLHLQKQADLQARNTTGQTYQDGDSETYTYREQQVAAQAGLAQMLTMAGDITSQQISNNPVATIAIQNKGV